MNHLINPNESRILENAGDRMPIGLMSIAANTPDTKVFDLNHMSWNDYMNEFDRDKPEAVGVSVYTSASMPDAVQIAKCLKGETYLIAGGHHATHMPETLIPYFDSVVLGEGENSFGTAQPGIVERNAPDLSAINKPVGNLSLYGMNMDGKKTGTIITSRGCPYHCAFCGKLEDKVRFHKIDDVLSQVDDFKSAGYEAIYFLDDVFTIKEKRMKTIVQTMNMPFRVTTRANLVNPNKLETLAENGCEWLSLGIESGDDDILAKSQKEMTTKDNYNAVYNATKAGIKTKGFFIIGLPGETEETARKTINFTKTLREYAGLTQADFYFLTPFPGTPIWKDPDKFGINIRDKDFTKYLEAGKGAHCVVDTESLKAERIEELVEEAKDLWKN